MARVRQFSPAIKESLDALSGALADAKELAGRLRAEATLFDQGEDKERRAYAKQINAELDAALIRVSEATAELRASVPKYER